MLLAIDIGNTDIVLGIFHEKVWKHTWRVPVESYTKTHKSMQDAIEKSYFSPVSIDQVVLSSVVPGLTPAIRATIRSFITLPITLVGPAVYPHLKINVKNPEEIGSDLVANAVAAYEIYKKCSIIVDFGTALTFTTVGEDGTILGVAIAPGLKTAVRALFQHTAQLPEVPLEMPKTAIGKGTTEAVQAGVMLGYVGLVEFILAQIEDELACECKKIATGGLASVLTPLHDRFDLVDPMLTLNGLQIISTQYHMHQ